MIAPKFISLGNRLLVVRRFGADLDTPVSLYSRLTREVTHSFLLESIEQGNARSRYSVIGCAPDLIWKCEGKDISLNPHAHLNADDFAPVTAHAHSPVDSLQALIDAHAVTAQDGAYDAFAATAPIAKGITALPTLPPMIGSLFGYIGYETIGWIEELPPPKRDTIGMADALFMRPQFLAVLDHVENILTLAYAVAWEPKDEDKQAIIATATTALDVYVERLWQPPALPSPKLDTKEEAVTGAEAIRSNVTKAEFLQRVQTAKEYIAAGDVFQVVIGQRFSRPFSLSPLAFYRVLRRVNPAPYLFLFIFPTASIVGASPEVLVRVVENEITIRPLAGTRPRGATPLEDQKHQAELLADEKEKAEHLMLVDLARNDVGKVAEAGSVTVTEIFGLEFYRKVMHIVSHVTGKLRSTDTVLSALFSGFPAGTVSGAPKIRAMEIINELEDNKRGVYAGGVAYFTPLGNMDSCIALRTSVLENNTLHVQASAGIVADSIPESEYEECFHKAQALFDAADEAIRFAQHGANNNSVSELPW